MAKRPAPEHPSKSEAVRQYLQKHPGARPGEVVAALESQGVMVSGALASYVKYVRLGDKQRNAGPAKTVGRAPGGALAGDKADAIRAQIDRQGQRFRPRDIIAALAAEGVDVSLAEIIPIAQSLGMRPRKRS
ncbi:MAG TPA: hypothetical protein VMV10_32820 [Pirellulales bacterium]|nr:hypothetical protein [Pirellulales bacterium]